MLLVSVKLSDQHNAQMSYTQSEVFHHKASDTERDGNKFIKQSENGATTICSVVVVNLLLMSQFKFTNQRGISTVYLLKRLQMLNTFMIYRYTTYVNTYFIYSIFIQLNKGKYSQLIKVKNVAAGSSSSSTSSNSPGKWAKTANGNVCRWKVRERERWEKSARERDRERGIALNCLRNLMTAVHDTRKWPKQTNKLRERELWNQSQIDRLEGGEGKW